MNLNIGFILILLSIIGTGLILFNIIFTKIKNLSEIVIQHKIIKNKYKKSKIEKNENKFEIFINYLTNIVSVYWCFVLLYTCLNSKPIIYEALLYISLILILSGLITYNIITSNYNRTVVHSYNIHDFKLNNDKTIIIHKLKSNENMFDLADNTIIFENENYSVKKLN